MTERIQSQIFNVILQESRSRAKLIYTGSPTSLESANSEAIVNDISKNTLQHRIQQLRECVDKLLVTASSGQKRNGLALEGVANDLGKLIIPEGGFISHLDTTVHPQFDLINPVIPTDIPWEILEESFTICSNSDCEGSKRYSVIKPGGNDLHCGRCGEKKLHGGGKLSLTYHLSHLVRGKSRTLSAGNTFLLITNPSGDLLGKTHDPDEFRANHIKKIGHLLRKQGYNVVELQYPDTTTSRVLSALNDPNLVGVYYFGHGFFPKNGSEGFLLLNNDETLGANLIDADVNITAKCAFINACDGAATGTNWNLDEKTQGIAHVFAKGGKNVVIAPLWPVPARQAADMAVHFFEHAVKGVPSAVALREARRASYQNYSELDEPDLGWAAYRFFGDVNKALPVPQKPIVRPQKKALPTWPFRIFAKDGELDSDLFSFSLQPLLFRAAKRRNFQLRKHVSVSDLLFALIRTGDLTRSLLRKVDIDPDLYYQENSDKDDFSLGIAKEEKFAECIDEADDPTFKLMPGQKVADLDEDDRRAVVARWSIRSKADFSADALTLLRDADKASQVRSNGESSFSEQDLLDCILKHPVWQVLMKAGLPNDTDVNTLLKEREAAGFIDRDGILITAFLDSNACRVIETAHKLALHCKQESIPHRLILAGFLFHDGPVKKLCEAQRVDPDLVVKLMILTAKKEEDEEEDTQFTAFNLNEASAARIVIPMLAHAKAHAENPSAVTSRELFRSFAHVAEPAFKKLAAAVGVDLVGIAEQKLPEGENSDAFDLGETLAPAAKDIIVAAHAYAQAVGMHSISSEVLLAAFMRDEDGYVSRLLALNKLQARSFTEQLLCMMKDRRRPANMFPLDSASAQPVLKPMLDQAKEQLASSDALIGEQALFLAFLAVVHPEFRKQIRDSLGLNLDQFVGVSKSEQTHAPSTAQSDAGPSGTTGGETVLGYKFELRHFTPEFKKLLDQAGLLAYGQGGYVVRMPHLFAAAIGNDNKSDIAQRLLTHRRDPQHVKQLVLSVVPPMPAPPVPNRQQIVLSPNTAKVLGKALAHAQNLGRAVATVEDILHVILADRDGIIHNVLTQLGITTLGDSTNAPDTPTHGGTDTVQ